MFKLAAYDLKDNKAYTDVCCGSIAQAGALLEKMLFETSTVEAGTAAFALSGIGASRAWTSERPYALAARLAGLWRRHPDNTVSRAAYRALASLPVAPRDSLQLEEILSDSEFDSLWEGYEQLDNWDKKTSALLIAYYRGSADDAKIIRRAQHLLRRDYLIDPITGCTLRELLGQLGAPLEADDITTDDGDQRENEVA